MSDHHLRRRVLHGLAWTSLQSWGGRLLTVAIFMVMARALGPQQFGVAAAVVALLGLIQILCASGFVEAIIQRPALEDADANLPFWVSMALALLLGVALVPAAPWLARWIGTPGIEPLLLLAAPVPALGIAAGFQSAFWRRKLDYKTLALRFFVSAAIGGAAGIAAALAGWGASALVLQLLVSSVAGAVWLWWRPIWRPGISVRPQSFGPLLRFGSNVAAIRLVDFVSGRSIEFLIIGAHGVAALGLYAVGAKVYQVALQSISTSVLDVAMSAMSRLSGDVDRVRNAYLAAVQISAYVALPAFVAGAALTPELVQVLFGAKWVDAVPIMRLLMLLGGLQCLQFFNGTCLNALGHPRLTLMVNLIRMVFMLTALTLFPGRDAYGMTIAFVGAQLLIGPLSHGVTWHTLRLGRLELPRRVWPPMLCSALAYAAVAYAREPLTGVVPGSLPRLVLLGLLFVACVALLMLLFLRPQLRTVWALFRGRRG